MKQFDLVAQAPKDSLGTGLGMGADTPDGKTYACQLKKVDYQTPFSAFKDGDYTKCVQKFFNT